MDASCSALIGGAPALLRVAPVRMTEILPWGDPVADELLEFLQLGEASALLAGPDQVAVSSNLKEPASSWDKDQLADLVLERSEELLCDPCSSHEPATLGAIVDLDSAIHGWHRPGSPVPPNQTIGSTVYRDIPLAVAGMSRGLGSARWEKLPRGRMVA